MNTLTVRLYNVRFGDGILISVPDEASDGSPKMRHILIDVGNAASKAGGENELFEPVFDDILNIMNGEPLDLYVMTHEHLDHVQGPLWTAKNHFSGDELKDKLDVQHLWMPASSRPSYYDTHEKAKRQLDSATLAFSDIGRFLGASPSDPKLATMLRNNNRLLGPSPLGATGSHGRTADCVEYIRKLALPERTHYVHRSVGETRDGTPPFDLTGTHPFRRAELEIWAPEENSSEYYGRFRPMTLGEAPGSTSTATNTPVVPPAGVDAQAFFNLRSMREGGFVENLLAIDKAANNSGIAFCLKWRGWTLLFPGDVELRSWREMDKEGALSPIDFLKVGHHGSHNGTPHSNLLAKLFPMPAPSDRTRIAAVSTYKNQYSGIPHNATFDELNDEFACPVLSTLDEQDGAALTIDFEG
jgi:beta-lactamase superfamily II metal-dependent hydrolase